MLRIFYSAALLSLCLTLGASDTGPCSSSEHRQFDFWIGEWSILNLQTSPSRPDDPKLYPTGRARNIVYPVAGGCGIVEHWEGPLVWGHVHGFSLRVFDPDTETWTIILNWPVPGSPGPRFNSMEGAFRHGRGSFFSARDKPRVGRFNFTDITPDTLRWDQAFSTDGEKTWTTPWVMEMTRVRPDERPPYFTGPTPLPGNRSLRCPDEKYRALDDMIGEWSATNDEGAVSMRVLPILDGCALMAFVESGEWNAFQVRAVDPESSKWVEYRVESTDGKLIRSEGDLDGRELRLDFGGGSDTWTVTDEGLQWVRTVGEQSDTLSFTRR